VEEAMRMFVSGGVITPPQATSSPATPSETVESRPATEAQRRAG
jgi:hypothetical protein